MLINIGEKAINISEMRANIPGKAVDIPEMLIDIGGKAIGIREKPVANLWNENKANDISRYTIVSNVFKNFLFSVSDRLISSREVSQKLKYNIVLRQLLIKRIEYLFVRTFCFNKVRII